MSFSLDQFRLDDKVAIVTGAGGRGNSIGRAYALGLDAYVLATWHPSTRPARLDNEGIEWRRLQIVDVSADVVEFRASYRTSEGAGLLHERSRFVLEDGRWLYIDGVQLADQE